MSDNLARADQASGVVGLPKVRQGQVAVAKSDTIIARSAGLHLACAILDVCTGEASWTIAKQRRSRSTSTTTWTTPPHFLAAVLAGLGIEQFDLRDALNEPSCRVEAAEIIRGLIDAIILRPSGRGRGRTLTIDLSGHLAGILNLARETKRSAAGAPVSDQQMKFGCGGLHHSVPN